MIFLRFLTEIRLQEGAKTKEVTLDDMYNE